MIATRGRERPLAASRPAPTSSIAGRNSPDPTSAMGPDPGMPVSISVRVGQCRADDSRPAVYWPGGGRWVRCRVARLRGGESRAAAGRAFGPAAAPTPALTLLRPILGGLLVDNLTWRLAFLINVPLVAIALFAAVRHVEESRDPHATGHFDWLGSAVGAVAVGGLAFGGIHGQESHWSDPLAWISLALGAVCLILFPILMAIRPHPLVPLSLFRNREFAAINL